jgi:hypothetical protein
MLEKLKKALSEQVIDIFTFRMEDLYDMSEEFYQDHYRDMGSVLYNVQKHQTLKSLIDALYDYEFDYIGIDSDEMVDELLELVFESSK